MLRRNRLDTSRTLARLPNASQDDLNFAVSIAYYAVFHAACSNCADCLVGRDRISRSSPAWRQVYRAVEHGFARKQFQNSEIMGKFPVLIQYFAGVFAHLQNERHKAEYDPSVNFNRVQVLDFIETAEAAIEALKSAPLRDRRAFAVWMLMKHRP